MIQGSSSDSLRTVSVDSSYSWLDQITDQSRIEALYKFTWSGHLALFPNQEDVEILQVYYGVTVVKACQDSGISRLIELLFPLYRHIEGCERLFQTQVDKVLGQIKKFRGSKEQTRQWLVKRMGQISDCMATNQKLSAALNKLVKGTVEPTQRHDLQLIAYAIKNAPGFFCNFSRYMAGRPTPSYLIFLQESFSQLGQDPNFAPEYRIHWKRNFINYCRNKFTEKPPNRIFMVAGDQNLSDCFRRLYDLTLCEDIGRLGAVLYAHCMGEKYILSQVKRDFNPWTKSMRCDFDQTMSSVEEAFFKKEDSYEMEEKHGSYEAAYITLLDYTKEYKTIEPSDSQDESESNQDVVEIEGEPEESEPDLQIKIQSVKLLISDYILHRASVKEKVPHAMPLYRWLLCRALQQIEDQGGNQVEFSGFVAACENHELQFFIANYSKDSYNTPKRFECLWQMMSGEWDQSPPGEVEKTPLLKNIYMSASDECPFEEKEQMEEKLAMATMPNLFSMTKEEFIENTDTLFYLLCLYKPRQEPQDLEPLKHELAGVLSFFDKGESTQIQKITSQNVLYYFFSKIAVVNCSTSPVNRQPVEKFFQSGAPLEMGESLSNHVIAVFQGVFSELFKKAPKIFYDCIRHLLDECEQKRGQLECLEHLHVLHVQESHRAIFIESFLLEFERNKLKHEVEKTLRGWQPSILLKIKQAKNEHLLYYAEEPNLAGNDFDDHCPESKEMIQPDHVLEVEGGINLDNVTVCVKLTERIRATGLKLTVFDYLPSIDREYGGYFLSGMLVAIRVGHFRNDFNDDNLFARLKIFLNYPDIARDNKITVDKNEFFTVCQSLMEYCLGTTSLKDSQKSTINEMLKKSCDTPESYYNSVWFFVLCGLTGSTEADNSPLVSLFSLNKVNTQFLMRMGGFIHIESLKVRVEGKRMSNSFETIYLKLLAVKLQEALKKTSTLNEIDIKELLDAAKELSVKTCELRIANENLLNSIQENAYDTVLYKASVRPGGSMGQKETLVRLKGHCPSFNSLNDPLEDEKERLINLGDTLTHLDKQEISNKFTIYFYNVFHEIIQGMLLEQSTEAESKDGGVSLDAMSILPPLSDSYNQSPLGDMLSSLPETEVERLKETNRTLLNQASKEDLGQFGRIFNEYPIPSSLYHFIELYPLIIKNDTCLDIWLEQLLLIAVKDLFDEEGEFKPFFSKFYHKDFHKYLNDNKVKETLKTLVLTSYIMNITSGITGKYTKLQENTLSPEVFDDPDNSPIVVFYKKVNTLASKFTLRLCMYDHYKMCCPGRPNPSALGKGLYFYNIEGSVAPLVLVVHGENYFEDLSLVEYQQPISLAVSPGSSNESFCPVVRDGDLHEFIVSKFERPTLIRILEMAKQNNRERQRNIETQPKPSWWGGKLATFFTPERVDSTRPLQMDPFSSSDFFDIEGRGSHSLSRRSFSRSLDYGLGEEKGSAPDLPGSG